MRFVEFKRLDARAPRNLEYTKEGSNNVALQSIQSRVIKPREKITVRTGIALDLRRGFSAEI